MEVSQGSQVTDEHQNFFQAADDNG